MPSEETVKKAYDFLDTSHASDHSTWFDKSWMPRDFEEVK